MHTGYEEDEIHEVVSVEDGLPEDEAEDYNDGGNIGDDDHDHEDVVDEGNEYDTELNDNDQTNDEHYQTNDELNNEINEYQLEGYEPDSKSGKFVQCVTLYSVRFLNPKPKIIL